MHRPAVQRLCSWRTRLVPHAGAAVKAFGPLQQPVDVVKGLQQYRQEGWGKDERVGVQGWLRGSSSSVTPDEEPASRPSRAQPYNAERAQVLQVLGP